jgi:hypothetical protein
VSSLENEIGLVSERKKDLAQKNKKIKIRKKDKKIKIRKIRR